MTHFEFQKTSKTALKNRVKKRMHARESRKCRQLSREACTRGAPPSRAACNHGAPRVHAPPINKASPPSFAHNLARALGTLSVRIGRNRGFRGLRKGFLGSFRERDSSLGNLSLSLSSLSLFRDFGGFLE
jgi:hypothetical protein